VKQRKGRNNQAMNYIEGHTVVQRLNDIFDAEWEFMILSHEIREEFSEVMVLGKLTVPGTVRMQFGSSQLTRAKETGKIIAVGDDLKAATTDALKKCATLLGIGLYLYRKDKRPDYANFEADRHLHSVPASRSQPAVGNQQNLTGIQYNSRISQSQHKYLHSLAHKQGLTTSELSLLCQDRFGVSVDFLNKTDASSMIEELKRQPFSAEIRHQEPLQGQVA